MSSEAIKYHIPSLRDQAGKLHEHARKCKQSPGDCEVCKRNMKWFGELPPQVLSQVLEEGDEVVARA